MHSTHEKRRRTVEAMTSVDQAAAHPGYRAGEAGYRRIATALFAAGVATFALIYST